MAILISYPGAVQTAFNPTIWMWNKEDVDGDNINILVKDIDGNTLTEIEAEFINEIVSVNLKPIIKSLFKELIVNVFTYPEAEEDEVINRFFYYHNLFGRYVLEGVLNNRSNLVVNAVSQFGQTPIMTSFLDNKFLTGFDRIVRYEGYEYRLSFLHKKTSSQQTYVVEDGVAFKYEDIPFNFNEIDYHITFDVISNFMIDLASDPTDYFLRDNNGVIITDKDRNPITVDDIPLSYTKTSMPVDLKNIPKHPFYVRWINRFGGYDYWMFGCKQYITRSTTDQSTYAKYFDNIMSSKGDVNVYNKIGKEQAEVSSGRLTPNQYEQVSRLIFSPVVEWYNTEMDKWLTLRLENPEIKNGTHQSTSECQFVFVLPTPQLQF